MTRPDIVDVRVHLFPPMIQRLIWTSFEKDAWPIKYKLPADDAISFLESNGVSRVVGICYTGRPGMAPFLNDFMAELRERHPDSLVPFGAVFPDAEESQEELPRILDRLDFAGVKLHCHLLRMAPDDAALAPIFQAVAERGKVLDLHSGRVAKDSKNAEEIRRLCSVRRFRQAMRRTPQLKVIVPHIGYDEVQEYLDLMDEFPNLHFDTAMAFGGHRIATGETLLDARPLRFKERGPEGYPHLPEEWKPALEQLVPQIVARPGRFLYGSDFPHLPYEWDFEIGQLRRYLPVEVADAVFGGNAARLFPPLRRGASATA
jgi:uncharacterized protein